VPKVVEANKQLTKHKTDQCTNLMVTQF